jgi:vacuolar protein sorting-associated protein 54
MNNDIEFLITKLGKLDGFGDTGEYLQRIIKSKQVKTVEPATEPTSEKKEDESKENETTPSAEAAESKEPAEKKE